MTRRVAFRCQNVFSSIEELPGSYPSPASLCQIVVEDEPTEADEMTDDPAYMEREP